MNSLLESPDYALVAAKQNDIVVGFCKGIACQNLYGDCGFFMATEDLIVDKEHRRTGDIGAALMSAAKPHAVRRLYAGSMISFVLVCQRGQTRRW
ncbi:MAG: GNAT family N-acetyltransferase [Desulfonatronovibrio sp.]